MALEIERKYLVHGRPWSGLDGGQHMVQGYVPAVRGTWRIRIAEDAAWLTIKGPSAGWVRHEFEYAIPVGDARQMLDLFAERPWIEKTRYEIRCGASDWVLDVFHGANEGLVLAEIELEQPDAPFECPPWLGREVSMDRRYNSASLVQHPWPEWRNGEAGADGQGKHST